MDFPHISDTNFPILNNVNVYSYKNVFDYTRWNENTKIKLVNVLWNADYNDVVKFDSDEARDEYFNNIEDFFTTKLTTKTSVPPEGGLKLPIPYDVAVKFNYMVVDVPVMTSDTNPIEYEDVENGMRRWYFFINELSSRAPNTTMFTISLDVWTQYQNEIDISYMFLDRGHAPVAATSVEEYLSNPIENNKYLLTPDISPVGADIVASQNFIPYGNGVKYVCIASSCAPSQLKSLGSAFASSDYNPNGRITYSNTQERWGYQLEVHGFGAGNGYDYSDLSAPASTVNPNGVIANNTFVYAIPATEVYGDGVFFADIIRHSPTFMNTILGCFVVDENMIKLSGSYVIAGHVVYECVGNESELDVSALTIEDFNYDSKYARFAKLYTFPYATIELTDNDGEVVTVRIENTGNIEAHFVSEIAFPYVNQRVFFTGINGTGSTSYSWVNLNGSRETKKMPKSDWFEYCFEHEIPCYGLYMDGATAWYLDNFNNSVKGSRNRALVNYHNNARIANNTRENVLAVDATNVANTGRDASTLIANTANTTATNTANKSASQAANNEDAGLVAASNVYQAAFKNTLADATARIANDFTIITSDTERQVSIATTQTNSINSMTGSVLNMASAGMVVGSIGGPVGVAGGMLLGGLTGMIDAGVSAQNANNSAAASSQVSAATAVAQASMNYGNASATTHFNDQSYAEANRVLYEKLDIKNTLLNTHVTNNNNCMTQNTANTAATMNANARATGGTNDSNATYSREVGILNAKETLENAANSVDYELADAGNRPAKLIGSYSGNPTADYMKTRGIQMKIKTMPKSAIAQVGDYFARFGYKLDMIWDVIESGLCPMNYFCYWKCSDIWIIDKKKGNNSAIDLISTIFRRGVTVWKNPDLIGKVVVYGN